MHSYLLNLRHADLLDSTNDGSNERHLHFAADLSARLSSVLSFSDKTRHVHFDDLAATDVRHSQLLLRSHHLQPHKQQQQQPSFVGHGINVAAATSLLLASVVGRDSLPRSLESDARAVVLRQCGQTEPLPFDEVYSTGDLQNCRKIGEGVYGEVYMRKVDKRAVVLKIIPIESALEVNGETQKSFAEILSEIVITAELSALRDGHHNAAAGFVELLRVRCVRGEYPERLQELWELYRDNRGTENDHPEIFRDEQLYIVLELANAGEDLEAFRFDSAAQSLAALKQIGLTLAVAEQQLQFEHRDLHWGNILLTRTNQSHITFRLCGRNFVVPTLGVHATIIDYTLSRIAFSGGHGQVLFNDLAHDEELFGAGGDYQFDIYRLMRARLGNVWRNYDPFTNVLWLHYVTDKLIHGASYKHTKTRIHKHAVDELMHMRDALLHHNSASEVVANCGDFGKPVAGDEGGGGGGGGGGVDGGTSVATVGGS